MADVHVLIEPNERIDSIGAIKWTGSIVDADWMWSEWKSFGDAMALTGIDQDAKHT